LIIYKFQSGKENLYLNGSGLAVNASLLSQRLARTTGQCLSSCPCTPPSSHRPEPQAGVPSTRPHPRRPGYKCCFLMPFFPFTHRHLNPTLVSAVPKRSKPFFLKFKLSHIFMRCFSHNRSPASRHRLLQTPCRCQ
jgi:hypothetical protein